MADPATLTDVQLREQLLALGANVGPITATTRSLYEKQLEKRRAAAANATGDTTKLPTSRTRSGSKSPSRVSKRTVTTSTVVSNLTVRRMHVESFN